MDVDPLLEENVETCSHSLDENSPNNPDEEDSFQSTPEVQPESSSCNNNDKEDSLQSTLRIPPESSLSQSNCGTVYEQVRAALKDHEELSEKSRLLSDEDLESLAALISAKTIQMTKEIQANELADMDDCDWIDLENKIVCKVCLAHSKSEDIPKDIVKIKNVANFGFISKSQKEKFIE